MDFSDIRANHRFALSLFRVWSADSRLYDTAEYLRVKRYYDAFVCAYMDNGLLESQVELAQFIDSAIWYYKLLNKQGEES